MTFKEAVSILKNGYQCYEVTNRCPFCDGLDRLVSDSEDEGLCMKCEKKDIIQFVVTLKEK